MCKWPLLILTALLSTHVFALQVISAKDNETIATKISSSDVTRILVKGDRIKSVKGIKGSYTHENDEMNGEVYIQPTPLYQNRAFTLLLETEQGRHFTLLLNPLSIPAGAMMLVPKGISPKQAEITEKASDYESILIQLVRSLSIGSLPEGYDAEEIKSPKTYSFGKNAELKLKTVYQGLKYQGEIYELANKSSYLLAFDERSFYNSFTHAVSLKSLVVAPHSSTQVFRVVEHG